MGFIFRKRININKGLGLNLSKSGISSSIRTAFGSIGTKGFSVKTGIPGVYYRSNINKNGCMIMLIPFLFIFILIILLIH